ncbi:uncharacterized protein B0H64DRAFT_399754 [Chaetomium fimeti]|uniref:Carrier domain-containing protein n=1 Tax=Chaetomium fimeti TaxID=1854472 RepID=A0AAE0LQH7_9PEZI|nr:hypothetical protein B0H64DRAFT_399754 [Chaetomium fimeti]
MRDLDVNWAFFTPSVAALLKPTEVPSLRTLVFGGETASPENFQTWAPALYLINSFGPAECSIWTHCVPRPIAAGSDVGSTIGYGVGCVTWIVDPVNYHRLRPIGAVGEMLIEGPNVADGYFNEPGKTASTFVWDPAWKPADRQGGPMRLYKTGDLARHLPNGMVQYLGRCDHQVKLNGLRVELGEIEHQIRGLIHDDGILVAVEVVSLRGAGTDSLRVLAAFFALKEAPAAEEDRGNDKGNSAAVPKEGTELTDLLVRSSIPRMAAALKGLEVALPAALPSHMVPAAYIPLREMPLTASAKTDRGALKRLASTLSAEELTQLGAVAAGDQQVRQGPSTVMERLLARLWAAALNRSFEMPVDVRDNFFKIGGDSLAAMRLVSLAMKDGIRLSVEQVLRLPRLRDMALAASPLIDNTTQSKEDEQQRHDKDKEKKGGVEAAAAPFALVGGPPAIASALQSASAQLGVDETDVQDIYPCIPLQEGLLALSQGTHHSYVAQMVYELPSGLDLERFESAWRSVFEHWPILRTRFFAWRRTDGTSRLMQAVIRERWVSWRRSGSLADYLALDSRDRMQVGDRMVRLAVLHNEAGAGAGAGSESGQPAYFVMTVHHAIYDGWMLGLLLSSVRHAYAGLSPAEGATPYRAFVAHVEARDAESSRTFWQSYIGDAPHLGWPALPGPAFRPRSSSVCERTALLPTGGRGQTSGFTSTALVRAAFAILLGAYSDADDITFASTVYGRAVVLNEGSAATVAGPTLATLPVRVRVQRELLLREVMASVQADAAAMLAHEQEGMQNIRRLNLEALATIDAQALLVVQADGEDVVTNRGSVAPQLVLHPRSTSSGLANGFLSSAMVLEATVSGDKMHLVATHDDRIITARAAERFLRQMSHITSQLCEVGASEQSVDLRVADLELIPPEDADEMMGWNSVVPAPARELIHELVAAQAAEQPDAEALVSWEGTLKYRELNELSDRLAAYLWTHCALRSGGHVPLVFEKSMWTVVAMLAVLKVGASCAAMDPGHSPEKLRELAADIDAGFVLCSESLQELASKVGMPTFSVGPATCLGGEGLLPGENGASDTITPDHAAFLLFTSGSTGKPKAIVIDHAAFCSSIRGHGETLCYRKGSRNLQFTAYTSDVSMGEIFTSLSRGATVCIPSDDERMNDLAGAMERMRVDWAFLTPSVASLLRPDHVPTLRTLLFGGETATVANVEMWATKVHLINSFGPAETSIWSHAHPRFQETDDGSDIGWSLGCATWIVDRENHNRLMPIGAIGELLVEGPNVAAGYYNNPSKTRAVFLKGEQLSWLPANRRTNRIFCLGDLARWMPDGRVQFLGRRDAQVKLHGLKVDANEVENAIRAVLQDSAEVAVELVRSPERHAEDARLVAFISCTPPNLPQDRQQPAIVQDRETLERFAVRAAGLRTKLASRLATFMIPSFFIPLTAMPLSQSAKTNRKLLHDLLAGPIRHGFAQLAHFTFPQRDEIQPPTGPMEKRLHAIWSSALALDPCDFGVEADFFEKGGDSIAAMRMSSLARAVGVWLSVQDIYDHPRLLNLASVLAGRAPAETINGIDPLKADGVAPFSLLPTPLQGQTQNLIAKAAEVCQVLPAHVLDIYPCTPTQRSIVSRTMARPGAWWLHNVFDVPADIDLPRLERAWHRVVQAHDILRTRVLIHEGHYLQAVLCPPTVIQHVRHDAGGTSLQEFLDSDMHRLRRMPSLEGQPLVSATLLNEAHFVLTLHHSVYDAWSLTNMFNHLEQMYLADRDPGTDGYHPPQFKSFVKALLDQNRAQAVDFWTTSLAEAKTKPIAQLDQLDQGFTPNRVLRHRIELPTGVGAGAGAGAGTATHAEVTYAAVALALHCQSQTPDTLLRIISTGRTSPTIPDIAELVGPTVTVVPLLIQRRTTRVPEYLAHVRAQLRRAAPFEHFAMDEAAHLAPTAGNAYRAAPQVVVHPHDPYTEQPATKINLRRRELSVLAGDGAAFTVDVSLVVQGKVLQALDVRVIFDDRAVNEKSLRRLIADLDLITRRLMSGAYGDKDTAALTKMESEERKTE